MAIQSDTQARAASPTDAASAATQSPAARVSVVVITRNRPHDLRRCLPSVLDQEFAAFELVVVDQSTSPESGEFVATLAANDARIRYVHDEGKGAARARNIGIRATSGDIIVFTDDDCEPDSRWLGTLVESIANDPAVGITFGSVIPAPHDPKDGFIVGFNPSRRIRLEGRLAKLRDAGISANVAVRRSALEATGGFDEMLGPGSYFPCAEDFDLTYRVLSHGFALLHVPEARVLHHGLRDWQSGGALITNTYVAIGAAYMKHIRRNDMVGLALLTYEFGLAVANILRNVVRLRGPFGVGRLRGLLLGAIRSYEVPIDASRGMYVIKA
jgi:GT2 family glycosyltransferase